MSNRTLPSISALTFADYLLWHWSLSHGGGAPALISGLTLPPLALALGALLALGIARLLARGARLSLARLHLPTRRPALTLVTPPAHAEERPRRLAA